MKPEDFMKMWEKLGKTRKNRKIAEIVGKNQNCAENCRTRQKHMVLGHFPNFSQVFPTFPYFSGFTIGKRVGS